MPDYTVVNLERDVEDMAPKFGMEGIEARFARTNLGLRKSGLSLIRLDPDARIPFGHRHAEQEEVYVLLRGSGRVKLEDELVDLGPLDAVRIPDGIAHSIAAGPDGAELLFFGAPNTDNKDVEMIQGFWG